MSVHGMKQMEMEQTTLQFGTEFIRLSKVMKTIELVWDSTQ
jgi:hypothetical protein